MARRKKDSEKPDLAEIVFNRRLSLILRAKEFGYVTVDIAMDMHRSTSRSALSGDIRWLAEHGFIEKIDEITKKTLGGRTHVFGYVSDALTRDMILKAPSTFTGKDCISIADFVTLPSYLRAIAKVDTRLC